LSARSGAVTLQGLGSNRPRNVKSRARPRLITSFGVQHCTDREDAVANYFREWAQRCRALSQIATNPQVAYQLQVWAIEFDRDADEEERHAVEQKEPEAPQAR
jgi:hypothetical protein